MTMLPGGWVLGACEIAAEPGDLDEVSREGSGGKRMGGWIGDQAIEDARLQRGQHQRRLEVRLEPGLSMVNQNTRQLRMQNTASNRTSRSAVLSRACSARHPISESCGIPRSSSAWRTSEVSPRRQRGFRPAVGDELPVRCAGVRPVPPAPGARNTVSVSAG